MANISLLAPAANQSFTTRSGNFTSDVNGLLNVPVGLALADLIECGCVPLAASPFANPRNFIDGGDFTINPWQRNIAGLATAGVITTAISNAVTYFADRFFAVGGASSAILMANVADASVAGFSNSLLLTRQAANANTAPINFGQVVETADAVKAQGQTVTFSFWARTGANYSGGNLSVALISGTGANQSAANMVAGSWTGQSSVVLTPAASNGTAGAPALQPLSSGMTRYAFTGTVPAGATQLGVLLTFTPTGTAGTQDGIFFNGFQLEIGANASPFEKEDVQIVLEECQRYAWVQAEPAAGVVLAAGGASQAANAQVFVMGTPVQMLKAPTLTVSAGTFKVCAGAAAAAATSFAAGATHTPNQISVAAALTQSAGGFATLQGGGGSGYIAASADF